MQTGDRYRSNVHPVLFDYRGTVAAVQLVSTTAQNLSSISIKGCQFDGRHVNGSVDGLLMQANAGSGDSVEGVRITDTAFTNFPRYQIHGLRTVFDIIFTRVTAENPDRSADDTVRFEYDNIAGTASQWSFEECWLAPFTAGKWAAHLDVGTTWRFIGGTIAPISNTSNGIWVVGGVDIIATHIECVSGGASFGVRYVGSNGARLQPAAVNSCNIGIQIGDPAAKANNALGAIISGDIVNNTTADIQILDGGNRDNGVIIQAGSPVVIDNLRESIDGISNFAYLFQSDFRKQNVTMGSLELTGTNGILQSGTSGLTVETDASHTQPILFLSNNASKIITVSRCAAAQTALATIVQNSTGTNKFYVDCSGLITAAGGVSIGGGTTIANVISQTATWNPGTIASHSTATVTLGAGGCAAGNIVTASHTQLTMSNMLISAYATGSNVVVTIYNGSGSPVTVSSGTVRTQCTVF